MKRIIAYLAMICIPLVSFSQDLVDSLVASKVVSDWFVDQIPGHYTFVPGERIHISSPTGEVDLIKYAQTLPGSSAGVEGQAAMYVRGGTQGNSRLSLDGVPIYGTGHLLGFSTVISSDYISEATCRFGGFSGNDINVTSAHLSLISKDADYSRQSMSVSVDPYMVGTLASCPVVKGKSSLMFGGRVSPMGAEYKMFGNVINRFQSEIDYLDIQSFDYYGKFSAEITPESRMSIWSFGSRDKYGYNLANVAGASNQWGWDNLMVSANLDHDNIAGFSSHSTLSYNYWGVEQSQRYAAEYETHLFSTSSSLKELTFSTNINKVISQKISVKAGLSSRLTSYAPEMTKTNLSVLSGEFKYNEGDNFMASASMSLDLYAYKTKLNPQWKTLFRPELGLIVRQRITGRLYAHATFDYKYQFFHELEGVPMGWTTDPLVPSDDYALPERSMQVFAGLAYYSETQSLSIGLYSKQMDNLVYYLKPKLFFDSPVDGWRDLTDVGIGKSNGLEVMYQLNGKRAWGTLSYTLSKSDRQFEHINKGEVFPAKFDRRHILNATGSVVLNKRESYSVVYNSVFTFCSGHWETIANCTIPVHLFWSDIQVPIMAISKVNDTKMPYYMRWDNYVSLEWNRSSSTISMNLGVYNTLNRHNQSAIIYDSGKGEWQSLSIFPIMPVISIKIQL